MIYISTDAGIQCNYRDVCTVNIREVMRPKCSIAMLRGIQLIGVTLMNANRTVTVDRIGSVDLSLVEPSVHPRVSAGTHIYSLMIHPAVFLYIPYIILLVII